MVTLGGYGGRVFEVAPSGGMETAGGGAPLALTVTPEKGDSIR